MELVLCRDLETWDALVKRQPRATVFHRRAWLEALAAISGARLHPYVVIDGDKCVGVLPLYVFRRGPFRVAASPPPQAAAPVLGPAVDSGYEGAALAALARTATQLHVSYIEVRLAGDLPAQAQAGLTREPRSTYVVDLSPGEDILWEKRLSGSCRRAIRKARSRDLVVEEGNLHTELDRYYRMVTGVYAKMKRPAPLRQQDYAVLASLGEREGLLKFFAVRSRGELVGGGLFPSGNGSVYYLDGASDPAAHQARPNNLLQWEVICWAVRQGFQRYDMVGAGIPGVARFKRGFGPEEEPYTYGFRALTPLARWGRAAYGLVAPRARQILYWVRRSH